MDFELIIFFLLFIFIFLIINNWSKNKFWIFKYLCNILNVDKNMSYSSSGSSNNNNCSIAFNCNSSGRRSLNNNIFLVWILNFEIIIFKIISFDYFNNTKYKKNVKVFILFVLREKIFVSSCRRSRCCGSSVLVVVVVVILGIVVLVLAVLL